MEENGVERAGNTLQPVIPQPLAYHDMSLKVKSDIRSDNRSSPRNLRGRSYISKG